MFTKEEVQQELNKIIETKEEFDFEVKPVVRDVLYDNLKISEVRFNSFIFWIDWKVEFEFQGKTREVKGFTNNKKTPRDLAVSIFKKVLREI